MFKGGGLFRPDRGWQGWSQALIYLAIYIICLGISLWNLLQFELVIFWAANGALLAACLQLGRRYSVMMLLVCTSLNLGSSLMLNGPYASSWIEPGLNLLQVLVAMVLTRRLCGARMAMHHPRRILTFAFGAALPAVLLTTLISIAIRAMSGGLDWQTLAFMWRHIFLMEYLGLFIMTPCLLLWSQKDLSKLPLKRWIEGLLLLGCLCSVVIWVFLRSDPSPFVIILPLMVMAYRLPPPWVGAGLIAMAFISGVMTLYGLGPVANRNFSAVPELEWASDLMHQMPLYYALILVMMAVALPISALITDRERMLVRAARHSRKAREQSRVVRDAVEAKSRFLALVSHEMRTPLNSIQGFTSVLRRRQDLPQDVHYQLEAVAASGDALVVLIDDLLEETKGDDRLSLASYDLQQVVRLTVAEDSAHAVAKGLGVRLDLEPLEGVIALCDGRRIRAALHQIMSNAVKFSQTGEITLSAQLDAGWLILRVHDQGQGIGADFVPRLFDLFAQEDTTIARQHSGVGIGLLAARRHARVMGGDVVLVSTSHLGSVFELKVRVEVQVAPQAEVNTSGADQAHRILVVDDHELNRSVLRMMMSGEAYQVEEADAGQSALSLAARSNFDLILMDLRMPGMDGFEASRQIRKTSRGEDGLVIIAVTADSGTDLADRLTEAGIDALLSKPFSRDQLLDCLKAHLAPSSRATSPNESGQALVG